MPREGLINLYSVIPVHAGIQLHQILLDARLCGHDVLQTFPGS